MGWERCTSSPSLAIFSRETVADREVGVVQGKLIRTLSEHAHWVNTLALNTDFVLRTGSFDQHGKVPKSDAEGNFYPSYSRSYSLELSTKTSFPPLLQRKNSP